MNPQAMEALAKGNAIRIEMAEIKRGIKSGEVDPVDVVHECELPIKVADVLNSIPRVGPTKAARAMRVLGMNDNHVLGGDRRDGRHPITPEQRIKLAEHIAWRVTGAARWKLAA